MLSTSQITRCHAILEHYGTFTERDKAIEELSEASIEMLKLMCGLSRTTQHPDKIEKDALAEEMADVLITITHMVKAYGLEPQVDELLEFKIQRQEQRMSMEKKRFDCLKRGGGN